MLVVVALVSFIIGLLFSSYCRLYLALCCITDSWSLLVGHAIKKREALISLCRLSANPVVRSQYLDRLLQEEQFLKNCISLKKRNFLKQAREAVPTFHEMEAEFLNRTKNLYSLLELALGESFSQKQFKELSENFWAADNLFSFETTVFEQAVEKYEDLRTKPTLQLAKEVFRFSSVPEVKFNR
ncbi:hypothetical protein [Chlamydiifrater phoenicopteri]|uniref:hypothetical protein n=1 Tax=Chlamydiifrater phoenicopteri TaxID=2681469 RepID=UPI001BCAB272|nr:hypothetical protein [Chlamydiifrater phoenicopteri]